MDTNSDFDREAEIVSRNQLSLSELRQMQFELRQATTHLTQHCLYFASKWSHALKIKLFFFLFVCFFSPFFWRHTLQKSDFIEINCRTQKLKKKKGRLNC